MGPTLDALPKDRTPSLEELHSFLWNTSMETFNDTFMINSTAMFYTMLAFLPLLDAGNKHPSSPTIKTGVKSQFIATSSIGAFSRKPGAGFAYAGSKAAVIHMVKQLSTNLVPYQIRANVIAPGIYPSVMSDVSCSPKCREQDSYRYDFSSLWEGKTQRKKARCLRVWCQRRELDLKRSVYPLILIRI